MWARLRRGWPWGPGRSGGGGIGLGFSGCTGRLLVWRWRAGTPCRWVGSHGIAGESRGLRRCTAGGSPSSRGRLGHREGPRTVRPRPATVQRFCVSSAQNACYTSAASRRQPQQGPTGLRSPPGRRCRAAAPCTGSAPLGQLVPLAPTKPQRPIACIQVNGSRERQKLLAAHPLRTRPAVVVSRACAVLPMTEPVGERAHHARLQGLEST